MGNAGAALAGGGSGSPQGDEPSGGSIGALDSFTNAVTAPAIVPGAVVQSYGMYDFVAAGGALEYSANAVYTDGSFLALPLRLPSGARVQRIDVLGIRGAAGTQSWFLYKNNNFASTAWSNVASISATGTGDVQGAYTTPFTVAPGEVYYFDVFTSATNRLVGASVQYFPAAGMYVPINPVRVYDSRAAAPSPGILAANASRVVSVKDGRNSAGTVTSADIVPAGARAITFNVTATATSGPNYLSVTPGDAAGFSTSTMNWSGGYDIANASTVSLDSNRQVKVFMGDQSGSAHFIIDVTGYYV